MNGTKLQFKAPVLLDARQHSSDPINPAIVAKIRHRDHVRLATLTKCAILPAQTFWARVILQNSDFWIAQVETRLLDERLAVGDLIKFHPRNIFGISINDEE